MLRLIASVLRPLLIIGTPEILFYFSLLASLLFYGGHHHAFLFDNPYCSGIHPQSQDDQPWSSSLPPRLLVQLSDIHISDPHIDAGRSKRHVGIFERRILNPWGQLAHAVFVTGDLVNAIERNDRPLGTRSEQLESEWAYLADFTQRVDRIVPWYATHGNHDTFGGAPWHYPHLHPYLSHLTDPHNRSLSTANRVLAHTVADSSLTLLAIDLTQTNPIHRPYNFFGDASAISSTSFTSALENSSSTAALAFAHYPSSVLLDGTTIHSSASDGNRNKNNKNNMSKPKVAAFLSGHLHSLYGFAPMGLSAVSSVSGALELQTLDLVSSGAFRVLAFDHSDTLVTTTTLSVNATGNPLDDLVFLNPPIAGLCPAGAGSVALESKYIRILSPFSNLVASQARASIDGLDHGPVVSLNQECTEALSHLSSASEDFLKRASSTCAHLYGFEWDPQSFKSGTHDLTLTMPSFSSSSKQQQEEHSKTHTFSLDGSAPAGMKAFFSRLMSVILSLSQFDQISYILCYAAVFISCSCCIYCRFTLRKHRFPSLVIFSYSVAVLLGLPILIAPKLTTHPEHEPFGFLSLYSLSLPGEPKAFPAAVDAPFITARRVLWSSLVQASFIPVVAHAEWITRGCHPALLRYTVLYPAYFALRRSYSWSMEIAGAHGYYAALLSPACAPLFILIVWSSLSAILKVRLFTGRVATADARNEEDKKDK